MPTGTIEDISGRVAVPIYYDSNINKLIFEIFAIPELAPGGAFYSYMEGYQSQNEPLSNIQIHVVNLGNAQDYISFIENRNFEISEFHIFGYQIPPSKYTSEFMDIISSGINDYIPPRIQRTLVYDFKFIQNTENYVFIDNEVVDTAVPEGSATEADSSSETSGASAETSGDGYAY